MNNVGVFHPGTQHSWQTANALQDLGRLAWFATSIFYRPDRFPYVLERFAPGGMKRRLTHEFGRFAHPGLDPALVHTFGFYEWAERAARRAGAHGMARALDARGNRRFSRSLARLVSSSQDLTAFWGFDGVSRQLFEQEQGSGRRLILDRTTPDMRTFIAIQAELRATHGEWFRSRSETIDDARIEQDEAEYALADAIVCGSDFCAQTLREHSPANAGKVRVLPYCYDEHLFGSQPPPAPLADEMPVRFLFSGRLWPAKGIHHALEAIAAIPRSQAELTLVGDLDIEPSIFARYTDRVTLIPQVPRRDMPRLMQDHHVLLFPSHFEGGGLVLHEALASGMALIQTRRGDVVATNRTGIVLDEPRTDLVLDAMLALIHDRDRLNAMRSAAQDEAGRRSFARYRDGVATLLADLNI
ncbi:glycosyltransferase [Croceicoccus ponticola]|uniref:Glycosyltransferase n=1 Tax=Croceicoccus ponticola TaxID=2217664 RepID=A0A437GY60_9SPHN|nr:glycosyltransferase family 4 protein [Croceicoccus ponticola]RVQ67586.1 glycosyltransferase [Croceicoccus ponticola]